MSLKSPNLASRDDTKRSEATARAQESKRNPDHRDQQAAQQKLAQKAKAAGQGN